MKFVRNLLLYLFSISILILVGCTSNTSSSVPVRYEYKYEIINTRDQCEPDLQTWTKIYMDLGGLGTGINKDAYAEGVKAVSKLVECTGDVLQSHISQLGDAGWRLVSFEALPSTEYDFGVEYVYRLVWERPKTGP